MRHPVRVTEALDDATLLEELCEVVPVGIAVLDTDLRYLRVNRAFSATTGADLAEHVGRSVRELLPDAADGIECAMQQVLASGEALLDEPLFAVPGEPRSWLASYHPRRSEHGEVVGILAVTRDVTAQRDALQESEARFRQAVESAPDGLTMVDAAGLMQLVNSKMEVLFGYSRAELLGQPIDMLMPERSRAHHPALMRGFFANPSVRDMANRRELYARRKDGSEFPVEIGLNPIPASNGQLVLASIADVTARKAAQAQIERALAEKTALLDEVHHRVKNNLQVVSSLLNLQTRSATPEAQAVLAESQRRVRAMALIHQLLYERRDFSEVDLGTYLERLVALLRDSMARGRAGLRLRLECSARVVLDLQRAVPCGLVVNELVTNAIKHAFPDNRSGEVLIALQRDADGSGRIIVADDGVGLPPAVQPGDVVTIGFQLLPLLVDQLQGQFFLHRDAGTRFEIVFPADKEAT
ncbi:sensor histidine kinase [Niveibacterium sp.]|uniref:sensor histidine kinase n=1 Tax=Niveibacterium sp. TaxID=2017444 RepID=UPI0035B1D193